MKLICLFPKRSRDYALGRLQFNRGHYDQALKTFAGIEQHLISNEDFEQLTAIQAERAAYYLNHYDYDRALALYLQIDEVVKMRNGGESSDHMLLMLGVVYRRKKAYSQAVSYLLTLLERAEAKGNRSATATAAHHLAWAYLCQGDSVQARQYCGKALALYRGINDPRGTADAYEQAGRITLAEGHAAEAIPDLEQALRMKETLGSTHGMASSLRHLAIAHLGCGEPLLAARLLWRSLSLYQRLGTLNWRRLLSFFRQICYCLLGKRGWAE
jgi:tetratricopeptide (TPR) repeat protein